MREKNLLVGCDFNTFEVKNTARRGGLLSRLYSNFIAIGGNPNTKNHHLLKGHWLYHF